MAGEIDDGGPAFAGRLASDVAPGMSLRDYFAAHALIGLIDQLVVAKSDTTARAAYFIADAMIAVRKEAFDHPGDAA